MTASRGIALLLAAASAGAVLIFLGWGFAQGAAGTAFGALHYAALLALVFLFARSLARSGYFVGDITVASIVVVIAALLGLVTHGGPYVSQAIWMGFPRRYALMCVLDGIVGYAAMGLVLHALNG